jgi:hypothetical protein
MHMEKNVCDNILCTLLSIKGKTKDDVNARLYMVKHRPMLNATKRKYGKYEYRTSCYELSRDEWYVSNVSIIFYAPCLFYTICLMFRYTLWQFYAFSVTNLLTSCHSASSLFSAVFVFQKSYTGNILRIGRNQSQSPRISPKLLENWRGVGVGPWGGHTSGRCGPGPGHAPYVWDHLDPLLTMPLRL